MKPRLSCRRARRRKRGRGPSKEGQLRHGCNHLWSRRCLGGAVNQHAGVEAMGMRGGCGRTASGKPGFLTVSTPRCATLSHSDSEFVVRRLAPQGLGSPWQREWIGIVEPVGIAVGFGAGHAGFDTSDIGYGDRLLCGWASVPRWSKREEEIVVARIDAGIVLDVTARSLL